MQYFRILLSIVVAASVLSSCEKAININTPPVAHKLVLNCSNMAGKPVTLLLTRNASIKEKNPDFLIGNATVTLYTDGVFTETLAMYNAGQYYSVATLQAGHQYTIKASAPSYPDISATLTVPTAVPVASLTRALQVRKDQDGNLQDLLTLTFTDPGQAGDYYLIRINGPHDTTYNYMSNFCVYSPDAGVENFNGDLADDNSCLDNNGIFMRDELFNGRVKELKLYVPSDVMIPQYNGTDSLYGTVQLFHVTEDYFKFLKSYKVAEMANGDPFSEPVNVYTNVLNGYGIFSVLNVDERQVR